MKILGIETSCDETAAAVLEDKTVLSNIVASSQNLHIKTGGIIPENAAREQIKSVIPVITEALEKANKMPEDLDAIAVTYGPGLIGSLLVGVETAKTLSYLWNKPLIPVNHLIAHLYVNWIKEEPEFPIVGLVVSGGHTDLVIMQSHEEIKWIGGTRDDAAGEAFDKTARLLNLPYPGGPSISKAAERNLNEKLTLFPRPMIHEDNLDFSFSGLKTAVLNYTRNNNINVNRLAAEIQESIVDVIVNKSLKAIKAHKPKSFLLSGGVAANSRLREKLTYALKNEGVKFYIPEPKLCTDNAVSTAIAAFYHNTQVPWQEVTANPNLTIED